MFRPIIAAVLSLAFASSALAVESPKCSTIPYSQDMASLEKVRKEAEEAGIQIILLSGNKAQEFIRTADKMPPAYPFDVNAVDHVLLLVGAEDKPVSVMIYAGECKTAQAMWNPRLVKAILNEMEQNNV